MNSSGIGLALLGIACTQVSMASSLDWLPSQPGAAKASTSVQTVALTNKSLQIKWTLGSKPILSLKNLWSGHELKTPAEPFVIKLYDGQVILASRCRQVSPLKLVPEKNAKAAQAQFEVLGGRVLVDWRISLHNGSNYAQYEVHLKPSGQDVDVPYVQLVGFNAESQTKVSGTVEGSPIVDGDLFFGVEHPMAASKVEGGHAESAILRKLPLRTGKTTVYSAVIGVAPAGQLRRGFLRYVERERARPYQPFLHYNSWYDLGYFNRYTSDQCVDRIKTFGQELAKNRGVKLSSFLFDDGWDDTHTVWEFTKDFPTGFYPLKTAAAEVGAAPGIWLSPWGGYGTPHEERIQAGKAAGMEIGPNGYALSGPKYFEKFRQVCLDLVGKYGINQFKLDGTGSPDEQYPGSRFGSDFDAAIQLIQDLRKAKSGLFVNLTTGTWPSPFWTKYADSIWRGGYDHSFAGVGTKRQQWITYRDGDTYHGIVEQGPLYPLNSLMLHGLIYGQYAQNLKTDPGNDFRDEVRDYFGTGTQLQEMYITPKLLTKQNWDDIAESAKWSRANAATLVDTHWVGGDPLKLQVYGWASWSKKKAILVLRNPNTVAQEFLVDAKHLFELPETQIGSFTMRSPYASDAAATPLELRIGEIKQITLAPFQVLVLEGSCK